MMSGTSTEPALRSRDGDTRAVPGRAVSLPPGGYGLARAWAGQDFDFLELGALPGAVPAARLHARQIAWEWGLAPLAGAVEQVVSELVANSVAAARAMPQAEPIRLWLLPGAGRLLILVWDASPRLPAVAEAGEDDESGRGLFLVQAFSERWGSYRTPETGGKIVWALCGPEGA